MINKLTIISMPVPKTLDIIFSWHTANGVSVSLYSSLLLHIKNPATAKIAVNVIFIAQGIDINHGFVTEDKN